MNYNGKNIVSHKGSKRKYEITGTVIKVNGRTVGQVKGDTFVKDVSSKKHFLHYPEEAIAYTIDTLHVAQRAGAEYVEVLDTDTGIRYRASIAKIWDMGKQFNYGWGDQIYLTVSNWLQTMDPEYISQTVTPEYSDPTSTHDEDVKPLHIKSRAVVGVTFKTGTKTPKQMSLFGGG